MAGKDARMTMEAVRRRLRPPARGRVRPVAHDELTICDGCDAVYAWRALAPGDRARCLRCGSLLGRGHALTHQGLLALSLAALLAFAVGNLAPIVTLDLRGVHAPLTLPAAIVETWRAGERLVALLAAATAFAFPLAAILLRLWVLLPLALGRRPAGARFALAALHTATQWSMVEVFLLGVLVSVARSAGLAAVSLGPGLLAWAALTVLLTAMQCGGLHALWCRAVPLGAAERA
jgi:paraquat-inducible protein A